MEKLDKNYEGYDESNDSWIELPEGLNYEVIKEYGDGVLLKLSDTSKVFITEDEWYGDDI